MRVIPVIDLMAGQVVHAVRGERAAYRPIRSGLCVGSAPAVVARALLEYARADTLYVADLDALTGGSPQCGALATLLEALPRTALWLDGGFRDAAALDAVLQTLGPAAARVTPVFASEALADAASARRCLAERERVVLSLDRRDGTVLDRADCWTDPASWPARVIVMTLERVGADKGPDLATLADVRARARPGTCLVGAGGIRDRRDLQAAERAGADAWLVASALHEGRIDPLGSGPRPAFS